MKFMISFTTCDVTVMLKFSGDTKIDGAIIDLDFKEVGKLLEYAERLEEAYLMYKNY